jgi:hypothetical protein
MGTLVPGRRQEIPDLRHPSLDIVAAHPMALLPVAIQVGTADDVFQDLRATDWPRPHSSSCDRCEPQPLGTTFPGSGASYC